MTNHADRIRSIQLTFQQANEQLIARLQQLDEPAATRAPADAWTPAQIGCHVALTTEFLSSAMRGAIADMAVPRTTDFTESLATLQLPDRVKTFPALEPPAGMTRADAVARLGSSSSAFEEALATATADRCANTCVKMPFGVVFSLYEIGEFTVGHVHRHIAQVDRTVGA